MNYYEADCGCMIGLVLFGQGRDVNVDKVFIHETCLEHTPED